MLKITHTVKGVETYIAIDVDGDYIDVTTLFSLTPTRKRINDYMNVNKHRKEYLQSVEALIKMPAIRPPDKYYHKMLIKPLLLAIDLLDFEVAIASIWGLEILPSLPGHEFSHSTVRIKLYDQGDETHIPIQILKRTSDGYYNLTAMLRNIKEGTRKTTTSLTKNKTMLYKRLYNTCHNVNEIKTMVENINPKNEKSALENARRILISEFVETGHSSETWVQADVFFSAMLDCSIDSHQLMSTLMSQFMFPDTLRDMEQWRQQSKCVSFELIDTTRKEQLEKELGKKIIQVNDIVAEQARERRDINKAVRLLRLTINK
jgi:hypothetical protein